jgi:hypothetical protein
MLCECAHRVWFKRDGVDQCNEQMVPFGQTHILMNMLFGLRNHSLPNASVLFVLLEVPPWQRHVWDTSILCQDLYVLAI